MSLPRNSRSSSAYHWGSEENEAPVFTPPAYYTLHTSPKTWEDASRSCKSQGGQLASFEYESEYEQYLKEARKTNSRVWLGIKRNGRNGWDRINQSGQWVTNYFFKWDYYGPSFSGNCVTSCPPYYTWCAKPCYNRYPYVCSIMPVV